MHYVVFLMHHGIAVYRDIIDVNMPGSYLVDDGILHVFGSGAIAWRACDFTLLAVAGAAMVALAWPYSRPGGLVAANTFAVLHCADGVAQAGQRDFQVAVLLLAGAACLLCAFRQPQFKRRLLGILVWGLCAGTAATIKPQFLIVGILVILVTSVACGRSLRSWIKPAAIGAAALAAPALLAALFVLRQNAIDSFFSQAVPLTIYHATMGRHSLAFLLGHAIPTKLLPIILVGLAGAWWRSPWSRLEVLVLGICASMGLLSFILQGKAYNYHRSTLIAFLLCASLVQLVRDLSATSNKVKGVAAVVLAYTVFWILPASTANALRWNLAAPTLDQLAKDIKPIEGEAQKHGGIQCLDTTAGCITALYRLQIVQSSGFLYDCYFFAPQPSAEQTKERERFLKQIEVKPPDTYIITDQWCFNLPNGYQKLDEWPTFKALLGSQYQLALERKAPDLNHAHLATWPFGYRIYRRRPTLFARP